jgi:hypothetical protein
MDTSGLFSAMLSPPLKLHRAATLLVVPNLSLDKASHSRASSSPAVLANKTVTFAEDVNDDGSTSNIATNNYSKNTVNKSNSSIKGKDFNPESEAVDLDAMPSHEPDTSYGFVASRDTPTKDSASAFPGLASSDLLAGDSDDDGEGEGEGVVLLRTELLEEIHELKESMFAPSWLRDVRIQVKPFLVFFLFSFCSSCASF